VGVAHRTDEGDYLKRTIILSSWVVAMGQSKIIVYQYSDSVWSDELETDNHGSLSFIKGDILSRRGKNWKIQSMSLETPPEDMRAMATLWVYLVDAPVN
jgi:hypothetical protein